MSAWCLYVGERGRARVRPLWQLVDALGRRGLRVAGFVQATIEVDGARSGSEVLRIGTGERVSLARKGAALRGPHEEAFCSMVFDAEAFATARGWLREDAAAADLVLLDEIGKLEVAGRGHADAVLDALALPCPVLLSVRGDQLFAALERFGLGEPFASCEPGEPVDTLIERVLQHRAEGR